MRKIAIYARYSSDLQNVLSCEDQDVRCREFIGKNAAFAETPIESYHDAKVSGFLIKDRPEIQRLIEDVESDDVLIVISEAIDRLSRSQEEIARIYKICQYHDVPIHTLYEGAVNEMHIGFKGTMNAIQLDEIAKRTRRGQAGNISRGKAAGGLAYGYKAPYLNAEGKPERGLREIDPEQSKIVKRIFDEFCNGKTVTAITRDLNKDKIPSARGGQWSTSTIAGHKGRGNGILQNPLYKGEMQWNRNNFKRHPTTGTRHVRRNSEDEIVIHQKPDLAIIDTAQWDLAQKIREERSRDQKEERDRNKKLPFEVTCGKCGAAMSRCDEKYMICPTFKAKKTCAANKKMRIDALIGAAYKHMTADTALLWMDWEALLWRKNYEHHQKRARDLANGKLEALGWNPLVLDEMGRTFFLNQLKKAAPDPTDLLNTILEKIIAEHDENGKIYVLETIPDYEVLTHLTRKFK